MCLKGVLRQSPCILGIRAKFFFGFLGLLLIPLVMLGVVGPVFYTQTVALQTLNSSSRLVNQVSRNVDQVFLKLEELMVMTGQYPPVVDFMRGDDKPETLILVRDFLLSCRAAYPEVAGILILNSSDKMLSLDFTRITRDPLSQDPWYNLAVEAHSPITILARPNGRNLHSPRTLGDNIVSVVKMVPSSITQKSQGAILLDLHLRIIERLFEGVDTDSAGFFFLTDENGEVVYAPANPVVYRIPASFFRPDKTQTVLSINSHEYQILANKSFLTGLYTVAVYSQDEAFKNERLLMLFALGIGVVTFIVAFMVSLVVSSSIAKPIVRLRSLMREAEGGNLQVRFPETVDDEVGLLGHSFNAMINQIEILLQQVYQEQEKKREAEFRVLQAQIKPHFLYNTLDSIQWMAQARGASEIVEVVDALTTLFRVSLSQGRDVITLKEELDHVKSYLTIQKIRYMDKFSYTISCSPGLSGALIPKLSLQPLVENALYHGIKERPGPGHLEISIKETSWGLALLVADNGVGMSDKTLSNLFRQLQEGIEISHQGFGVYSVHHRIKLFFGSSWGLEYESKENEGTQVTIKIPLIFEGNKND